MFRFGVAMWRYWMARDREQEAFALLLPVLDRPEARADPELFAVALSTATLAARSIDNSSSTAAGRTGGQACAPARPPAGCSIESLAALSSLCLLNLAREPKQGLPLGREAVASARQLGDDVLLGESLVAYLLCDALIDPAHARPLFAEAIACTQAIRRPSDCLLLDQLCGRSGAARWGHKRRPRSSTTGGTSYAGRRGAKAVMDLPVNMGWVLRQDSDPDGARSSFEASPADQLVATGIVSVSPTPASAWHAWPRTLATGTARPRSTASAQLLSSTGLDNRGENLKRATSRTASPIPGARLPRPGAIRASLRQRAWRSASDEVLHLARGQLTAPDPRQPLEPPGLAQLSAREREPIILVTYGEHRRTDRRAAAPLPQHHPARTWTESGTGPPARRDADPAAPGPPGPRRATGHASARHQARPAACCGDARLLRPDDRLGPEANAGDRIVGRCHEA